MRAHVPSLPGHALPNGAAVEPSRAGVDSIVFLACGLGWSASLIHVLAAVEHVDEYLLYAGFFVVLSALQFAWGVALYRQPRRGLLRLGGVASLLVVVLWVASRTIGLPLGPEPWRPEGIGTLDSAATADEIALALIAFLPIWPRGTGWRRVAHDVAVGLGVCLVLLSSLALVGPGHEH